VKKIKIIFILILFFNIIKQADSQSLISLSSSDSLCQGNMLAIVPVLNASVIVDSIDWNGTNILQYDSTSIVVNPTSNSNYDLTVYSPDTTLYASIFIFVIEPAIASFSFSPDSACAGTQVNFINTSSNFSSSNWNFGDNSTSTIDNPNHTYQSITNFVVAYPVTLIVTENFCQTQDSYVQNIHVLPTVSASFTLSNDSVCTGAPIIFTNTSTGYTSSLWDFGNSVTSPFQSLSYTYFIGGNNVESFTVILTVSNGFCPADNASAPVTIFPNPNADFSFSPNNTCSGNTINFTNNSTGHSTSIWNFGDNSSSNLENPTHIYTNISNGPQVFTINLSVSNDICPADNYTETISILPAPHAELTDISSISPFVQCDTMGSIVFEVFNSSTTTSTNTEYTINWGDGTPDFFSTTNWTTETHEYNIMGNIVITLTVSNSFGCYSTEVYDGFIGANPSIGLTNPGGTALECVPQTYFFPIDYGNDTGSVYTFFFTDIDTTIEYSYPPPDTIFYEFLNSSCGYPDNEFSVYFQAQNQCGITNGVINSIRLSEQPTADFEFSQDTACVFDDTVVVSNSSALGNEVSWDFFNSVYNCDSVAAVKWFIVPENGWTLLPPGSLGNEFLYNTPGYMNNPNLWGSNELELVFDSAGVYEVSLIMQNTKCGKDSISKLITIIEAPDLIASLDTTNGCSPLTVNFSNNSTGEGLSFFWDISPSTGYTFSTPFSDTSQSPTIIFNTIDTNFEVTLYVQNSCETKDTTFYIDVFGVPEIEFPPIEDSCRNYSVQTYALYDSNGTSINSYQWEIAPNSGFIFTDGTNSNSANISLLFDQVGLYTLSIIAENMCGIDTSEQSFEIFPFPSIEIFGDTDICKFDTSILSLLISSDTSYTIEWNTGESIESIFAAPQQDSTYFVTITNLTNCSDIDSFPLTVFPLPEISIDANFPICVNQTDTNLNEFPFGGYWQGPGITNISEGIFNPEIAGVGTHTIEYFYTDSLGCNNSDSLQITVLELPSVFAGNDTSLCNQAISVQFFGSPAGGFWTGFGIDSLSGNFLPDSTGTFEIIYTYTDLLSCTNQDTINLNVVEPAIAEAGADTAICLDSEPLQLFGNPDSISYWTGQGIIDSLNGDWYFLPPDTGIFTLFFHYGVGNCYNFDSIFVTVYPLPEISIDANFSICVNQTDTNLSEFPFGGYWQGPGITNISEGFFNPAIAGVGTHTIEYFYTDSLGCSNSDSLQITVLELPSVFAGNDTSLCNQAISVQFFGSPAGGFWTGFGIDSLSGNFLPDSTGTFEIIYTYTDLLSCTNQDTIYLNVVEPAIAEAGIDTAICLDSEPLQLFGNPDSISYWTGQGIIDSLNGDWYFLPPDTGIFTLFFHYGVGNCYNYDSIFVTVYPLPEIIIDSSFNICIYENDTNLSENPIGGFWSGVGLTDSLEGIFDPAIVGVGEYTLEYYYFDTTTKCDNTDSLIISVKPKPTSLFSIDSIICINVLESAYNLSEGASEFEWWIDDSLASSNFEPDIIISDTGYFDIQLFATSQFGCEDTSLQEIYVIEPPFADFELSPAFGCDSFMVGFTNNSIGYNCTYFWDFGNDSLSNAEYIHPDIPYVLDGIVDSIFIVELEVKNQCGISTHFDSVHVYSVPNVNFSIIDNSGCKPYTLDLSNVIIDIPLGWEWNFGDNTASTNYVTEHVYLDSGNYQLELFAYGPVQCINNGFITYITNVIVYENPTVSAIPKISEICENDSTIILLTGAEKYIFESINFIDSTLNSQISLSPSDTSYYLITGIDANNCIDTTSIAVFVEPLPIVKLGNDTCLEEGENIVLGINADYYTYLWSTGDTSQYISASAAISEYCLEVIPKNCFSEETCILIDFCPLINIPNAFSPNGDGNNDVLNVLGHGIEKIDFKIYNRWGMLVFHSNDINLGWDGSYQGKNQETEVYVYILVVKLKNSSELVKKHGNVTLLR